MSYDIHLLRFAKGEPQARPAAELHDLLTSAAVEPPDEHGYARVHRRKGEADLYGMPVSPVDQVEGLMFSRPSGDDAIFDLIYEAAAGSGMVVLLPEGTVCLTDEAQAADLPQDVQDWPRTLIASGKALAAVIRSPSSQTP